VTEFFKIAITKMYGDKNAGEFDEEDMGLYKFCLRSRVRNMAA
jgi:hypothetical protein